MLKLVQGKGSLPDGKSELEAEELLLTGVTRHHAGVYRCTASNGFGKGDTKVHFAVTVLIGFYHLYVTIDSHQWSSQSFPRSKS